MTEQESSPPIAPVGSDLGITLGGRYRLLAELGRGASGVVWDGIDLVAQQPVAVKLLHAPLLASPAARQRFRREVATARALDHPGLVRVRDNGQAPDGREYLVMERLVGRTFAALLAETGALPQVRAARIIAQILDAVAAAHRANVVHRDLKPGNVMLLDGGPGEDRGGERGEDRIKVCDFGLAKIFDSQEDGDSGDYGDRPHAPVSSPTGQSELLGTPEYIAPEQARGEPLDGRADLYSIAVMLFQAVVGELPFHGRTPIAVVSLHLSAPPPSPSALRPDLGIAPAMEKLILRGLAKDPRERPSSAEVFRADLLQIEKDLRRDQRRAAHRRPTPAAASTTLSAAPAARPSSRRPLLWALAGALLLGGAGAGALFAWQANRAEPRGVTTAERAATPSAPANPTPSPAVTATPPAEVNSPAGAAPALPANERERNRAASTRASHPPRELPARVAAGGPAPAAAGRSARGGADPAQQPPEGMLEEAEDLLASGQPARACEIGEQAAARAPTLARARSFLGRCYMRIGLKDKARLHYRKYLELAPDAADAPFVKAILGAPDADR